MAQPQIKKVLKKELKRRRLTQLQSDSNPIIAKNETLKKNLTDLIYKHKNLWAHHQGNRSYGVTQDIKFKIDLYKDTKPIKHKFRTLN